MAYEIYDAFAAIKFVRDDKESLVYKSFIKKIAVVREDIIKIEIDCCPGSICFRYSDVSYPPTSSIGELTHFLNVLIWENYNFSDSA